MNSAIIGHTGFVGGNIARQHAFDDFYNSQNIHEITGRSYSLLVCAGAPGVKWKANQEPDADWASISKLIDCLRGVTAAQFVLISTVDVYPKPIDVDEDTPLDLAEGAPYGRHRLLLEEFVREQFGATVIRLPGLFGRGLKKNIIFDFLHDNALDRVNPRNIYQFYNLDAFWPDLQIVLDARLELINFATEGVAVADVARQAFGFEFENPRELPLARYDFKSKYAHHFGGAAGYLRSRDQVLQAIKRFVTCEKAALAERGKG